jgi:hypothetical protein
MTLDNSSAHFPFFWSKIRFFMAEKKLSIGPFDRAIWLRVIHRSETKFRSNHATIFSEFLAIELLPVINYELSRDTESADDLLPEKTFWW